MVDQGQTNERRKHIRLDMGGELIELRWQQQSNQQTEHVICLDISRKGLKVRCEATIELYTPVEVSLTPRTEPAKFLMARVIRSIDRDGHNELALLFQD